MNVLVLGAVFSRNMGVCALASGIATSAWHTYPDAQVNLFDYNSEPLKFEVKHSGGTNDVRLINLRFSKRFWLQNNIVRLLLSALIISVVPFRSLRNKLYSRNPWLRHIQAADIVGSIAGGDSFSDIYGSRRLIYVSLPQILVLLMGKPLVLLPQTIGPFKSPFAKTLARYILKRAYKIYSRDKEGLDKIHELLGGAHRRLEFCYDMGFVLEPRIAYERIPSWLANIDHGTPVVGINVSGLLYVGGYTGKNMFGLKGDYRKLIHTLIAYFIQKHNAQVMLVPHVLGDAEHSESDLTACQKIYHETKAELRDNLHLIEDGYDHHELKALIGRCDFCLGSRMHACIAALSHCIPAVGLAYSRKFQGVFASIGMEELVIDLREHDEHSVVQLVDRIYQSAPELRLQLEEKMLAVRESVLGLFGRDAIGLNK